MIHIIGGGLAGSEAAWQAASRGVPVTLHEMRPVRGTAVHRTDRLAELVCSNSFRGDKLDNAVGLLKEEMRRTGSLILRAADAARVPAGAALAVDRERFAATVTDAVHGHPAITVVREEVPQLTPLLDGRTPVIVATGPLTSDALSVDIAQFVGQDDLYFYDAISPIVLAESIDMNVAFRASRWGRSLRRDSGSGVGDSATPRETVAPAAAATLRRAQLRPATFAEGFGGPTKRETRSRELVERATSESFIRVRGAPPPRTASRAFVLDVAQGCGPDTAANDDADGDYLNCPMTKDEYERFYEAVVTAESATVHDFDKEKFFEGCLPIEVMAHRGPATLRFGPMKPVGLVDPRTGRQPYAVVQLRQDNLAGDHYSLVGFQTQLKWGEQARVLRMIAGLEHAEFIRFGMVHRNTYINGPAVLTDTWQTRSRCDLFFAGQISGVEGYVESAASGLMAGRHAAAIVRGEPLRVPPRSTALGALAYYVSHADPRNYQPTNITFGIMEPLFAGAPAAPLPHPRDKQARKLAISDRALRDLETWLAGDPARDAADAWDAR